MKMYFTSNTLQCPVCNSRTTFKAGTTNIKVCPVCNTVTQRLEGEGLVKTVGLQAIKNDNTSLIKIGTRGLYKEKSFEVIGCLHCNFESYRSKRFTILFSDGTTGLLAETEGFIAVHEMVLADFPSKLVTVKNMKVGSETTELLKGSQLWVINRAKCIKTSVEGEVLLDDNDGMFTVNQLANNTSGHYELIELQKEYFEFFKINYLPYDSFSFTQTNDGRVSPIILGCDKCGRSVTIKLPQHSTNCVCTACGAWNEIVSSSKLKRRDKNFGNYKPGLPLGTKGNLRGAEYEVVGACVKTESGSIDTLWREYTLYNNKLGFAYLAEYNGHWTWLREVKIGSPWPAYKNELEVGGRVFDLFNDYSFKFKSAAGEFLTPLNGGNTMVREYIAPPLIYSAEFDSGKELGWFKGEFISNKEVFDGLGLRQVSMPVVTGVGPLQTISFHGDRKFLGSMAMIAVVIFFLAAIILEGNSAKRIVYQNTFFLPDSVLSKGITTNSFELPKGSSNLQFMISSRVSNSWFEAAVTLINDATGTEYNFEKGVEYYSGYSDGESWTEGSQEDEVILSSIPKGKYHLNIFPSFGTKADEQSFSLTVVNDIPMWQNFFIIVSILMLYPLGMWWRNQSFEQKRWNNSSYNPYKKDEDED